MAMRIILTNVSSSTFGAPSSNARRLRALDRLLDLDGVLPPRGQGALVVLPAGFLAAQTSRSLVPLVRQLSRRASPRSVTLLAGIDVAAQDHGSRKKAKGGAPASEAGLPYFVCAVGTVEATIGGPGIWRQTSTNSRNYRHAAQPDRSRLLRVHVSPRRARTVLLLACGELYRPDLDHLLRERPAFVAVCGHDNMTEPHRSLERTSRQTGGAVGIAQHLSGPNGLVRCWKSGQDHSRRETLGDKLDGDGSWMRVSVHDV